MFFFLSKVLLFLIMPVVWISGLMFYSLISKIETRKRKSFIAALALLYLFSNDFLLDEVMRLWEIPAVKTNSLGTHDAGIVLGGMVKYDKEFDRTQYGNGVDRLLQAIELYKKEKIKKIFFTGGSGSITYPDIKEAPHIRKFLLQVGIPDSCIIIEGESKNTHENAEYSKPLLEKKMPDGKFLLITSGFHMRRSLCCFRKAGIEVTPFSVDRKSGPRKFVFDHLFIPDVNALYEWSNLIHEWVGYVTYKIAGYG